MNRLLCLVVAASSIIATGVSYAHADQGSAVDPSNFCVENPQCSEPMKNIAKSYGEGFATFTQKNVSAFSGKCFHMDPIYDPDHAHFGAFAFESQPSKILINGLFGFFYEGDPFAGMTVGETIAAIREGSAQASEGVLRPDHVELAFKTSATDIRYWFRSDKAQKNLFVIGKQVSANSSSAKLVFCKLLAH
ncbi:hypothetical protein [Bdellovibrio svalbardensis]|uniref:Uncharacterized protein n=1 Tax=Bdellovibrio svalbardensis TaxID=2972972 RepID=A0ABT6DGR6_9BACT|nr:hypothetical protein [Bdellovibrio svalbardensis]MDG0816030.1 hypothetical protein [Bdellovibrio svalbardensis]